VFGEILKKALLGINLTFYRLTQNTGVKNGQKVDARISMELM
jgi:hypothetical protein